MKLKNPFKKDHTTQADPTAQDTTVSESAPPAESTPTGEAAPVVKTATTTEAAPVVKIPATDETAPVAEIPATDEAATVTEIPVTDEVAFDTGTTLSTDSVKLQEDSSSVSQEKTARKKDGPPPINYRTPWSITNPVRYHPEVHQGLDTNQVDNNRILGRDNKHVAPPSKTTKEIIFSNVFTYFNFIFLVLAILIITTGSFKNLTFLPIVIANALIGIIQEMRAKKILDDLSVLNSPHTQVVRNGAVETIASDKLVLDDVVLFKSGNQVCADAVILDGNVQVNESLLTGEADEIEKATGDTLLSGSYIVSGSCRARLDKVGSDSYISKLTLEAKSMRKHQQSEMIRSINRLVKIIGFLIIPIGGYMFYQEHILLNGSYSDAIIHMVAALIGMIPEGLYLLCSVALILSVVRLARKRVLVHDMRCIETLARVNVLCVDKTGTITEPNMVVEDLYPVDPAAAKRNVQEAAEPTMDTAELALSEDQAASTSLETEASPDTSTNLEASETASATEPVSPYKKPDLEKLVGDLVAAQEDDNITMTALKSYFKNNNGKKALSATPFSSALKYCSAKFQDIQLVLGAPEFILRDQLPDYQTSIDALTEMGQRVLLLASYDGDITPNEALILPVTPLTFITLNNPIRSEAKETFAYFAEQGVEVKVISGDNPVTVSRVACQAGIANAENYVDATTLKTEEQIDTALKTCTVFGRVTPEQKRTFVHVLKAQGNTVAMTGDGVNDVLALKDADCSVAMASGSDAAAHASQLVLLDSNFSCMPSVVLEGRRVINNLQRSSSLFLVKNIFSILLSLFTIITVMEYPLNPSQVSLISAFAIGLPAFLLALEPNNQRISGHFLTNIFIKALPAGVTDFLIVSTLVIFGNVFGVSAADISTASTLILCIVGMMILYRLSKPMNLYHWIIWFAMLVGMICSIAFIPTLFSMNAISLKCGMLLAVFAIITEPCLRYSTQLVENIQSKFIHMKQKRLAKKALKKK